MIFLYLYAMAKSQVTFNKQEKEKKRLKKRKDKQQKREERKANAPGGDFESMIAYVDENGNITDTSPDPTKKTKIDPASIEVSVPKKNKEEVPSVLTGRVEFFDDKKGFGFIKETERQDKYFVHANGLLENIKEGDTVTFELERGFKGLNCFNVKKIKIEKKLPPEQAPPETV
jgi:cold shock CspA family protein